MTLGDVILKEPTTPWEDFKARMKVGTFITGLLLLSGWGHVQYVDVSDDRWFRDLMHQTPFEDVVLTETEITENVMTVTGTMIKTRDCQLSDEPIIQVVKDGIVRVAHLEGLAPRPTAIHKAVSNMPQEFGPWEITSELMWPNRVFVYVTHLCGNDYQTNLFFTQDWGMPG